MRVKRAVTIVGFLIIIIVVFIIYSAKDLDGFPMKESSINQDFQENKWLHFENKIKRIEEDLNKHRNAVSEIKFAMNNLLQPSSTSFWKKNSSMFSKLFGERHKVVSDNIYDKKCSIQLSVVPKTNIQMLEVYKSLSFDNPDGGVWKQGWRIEVDEKEWNKQNKLKVFVVPHSHNDPGWIKTVEEYYTTQTKHILDNMLKKLPEDPRRKFIWAEISYFSMWWDELEEDDKEAVKRLIRNNQLEIVSGGWVMNDEANSHWISIMNQFLEGHQWLQENLNYTPVSHWSIDPFGLSLTQPALLKEMGLKNMLIQRVHYSVKKHLAKEQQLEFLWRQLWDGNGKTDMFTHMMPFYSYDIPHTCGPDPKICCQFDFKRLPAHGMSCPWRVSPQVITDKNIENRVQLLLDQYRKKSKLYKTNVLLAPLGDDFRYDHPTEWDVQYNNYQKLFDYMNSKPHLNVKAQFGTLSDYFRELRKEKKVTDFPVLSGDFFTYADRDDHYWSGYYTSRPFYKRMDRVLLSYIRAAETIHTLAYLSKNSGHSWIVEKDHGLLETISNARKSLSLFQHHDAITGTAKNHVVIDYANKMITAINGCQKVIQICTHILLKGLGAEIPTKDVSYYHVDDVRHSHNSLSEHYQITIGVPEMRTKNIVIFNSLTFTRREMVTFHVSTPFVEVIDFQEKRVICQISPIFEYASSISQTKYQLSFIAEVPPLGLVSYVVNALEEINVPKETVYSSVNIFNYYGDIQVPSQFKTETFPSSSEFTLQNSRVTASFNKLGLLKSINVGGNTVPVHLDFVKYGVRANTNSERSGAYLFLPDGDAVPLQLENIIVNVIKGQLLSSVSVQLPYIHHTTMLYNTLGADSLGIEIQNLVDIEKTSNFELAMRLSTNINSSEDFFTDVNGYQIVRRKRFKKLPLQANYYPMPTMAYIEDEYSRLTVTTSTPLGCSSLAPGQLEIMLDRRLNQDDNRGLGQGVLDNHPTRHIFRIVLEKRVQNCRATAENHPAGFPTLSSHVVSQTLLNPIIRMLKVDDGEEFSNGAYTFVKQEIGVDISIPILKNNVFVKGTPHVGLVVHRQFLDICFSDQAFFRQFRLSEGVVNVSNLIPGDMNKKLYKTSLSFLTVDTQVDLNGNQEICPMKMQAFILGS